MTAPETTTEQQNIETVERFFAAYGANDPAAMDETLAPDLVAHGLPAEFGSGATAIKGSAAVMHAALHNCRYEINDVLAHEDRVAVRYTTQATHVGEVFGAAPSGRTVTMTGIEIYRVTDGRITEYWGEANMSELFAGKAAEPSAC